MLKFEPKTNIGYDKIDKYTVQGFIYSILKNNQFKDLHNNKGFKFFNFSNIFPISDFERNSLKKLIISSPNDDLIKGMYNQLKEMNSFHLKNFEMELLKVSIMKTKSCSNFISATPIVLFEDNQNNKYFSFKQNNDSKFFFNRLKDNATKKYNAFYDDDFELEGNLFKNFELNREVSIRVEKNNNKFIIIGTLWKNLEFDINNQNKKFYRFLFDCGLGEKNSLGFGFLNCRR